LRAFGVLAAIVLGVSSAEAQTTAPPPATAFYGVGASIVRPNCGECSDPRRGPGLTAIALAPFGPYFAVGAVGDAAWFRYDLDDRDQIPASTYALSLVFRMIPVREHLLEPHFELGLGLGMLVTDDPHAFGPALRAGLGVGIRLLPELTVGPELHWLGVLQGSTTTCDNDCFTTLGHLSFSALGLVATFTPAAL
jgi:hypothetical protein